MQIVEDLDRAAARIETPCGAGSMVWRVWNQGAGMPIVLLHGGTGSWRHWVRQIGPLSRDRAVIAPDLPGLGESAMPDEPHDPPHVARITASGLRQVLAGGRCDLVGFSFGATIGGQVAAQLGEAIRTLSLLGTGALGLPRNPVPLEKLRHKRGEERIAKHRFNLNSLMIADATRIDHDAIAIQEWNTVHARFRSRGFANAHLLQDALAETRMPLTVLWGDGDQIARGHIPARIAAVREARPDAEAEIIPDAGHWAMYEAPSAFDAALARSLARG